MSLNQYLSSVKGTEMHVAPKVLSGHYTKACDVFSLRLVFVAIIEAPCSHKRKSAEDSGSTCCLAKPSDVLWVFTVFHFFVSKLQA